MPVYQYKTTQLLKADPEKVWEFISSPENLSKITPPHMGFEIISDELPEKMYPGMMIFYKVSPLKGFRTNWLTEITQVRDGEYFVDEQRSGPYAIWHHEHILESEQNGVQMKDIITYKPPFGFLGEIANKLFIRKQLKKIFDYRYIRMDEMFNGE